MGFIRVKVNCPKISIARVDHVGDDSMRQPTMGLDSANTQKLEEARRSLSSHNITGVSRCTAATAILLVSFLAVSMAPTWVVVASVVTLLLGTECDWIYWTMSRLVDLLLGHSLYLQVCVFKEQLDMTTLLILMICWSGGHLILSVLDLYFPISWMCIGKWAGNSLTVSLVAGIRNVLALAWKAVVAVGDAAVAGATDIANDVDTVCSFVCNERDRVMSYLSAEQGRLFQRLDGLSFVPKFTTMIAILLSFWFVPNWLITASIVALLIGIRREWINWTMHRLVDLLFCWELRMQVFIFEGLDMTNLLILVACWAVGRVIVSVLDLCLPMLTFPLAVSLKVVWWAFRNAMIFNINCTALMLLTLDEDVAAAYHAALALATEIANNVRTLCSFLYNASARAVSSLSVVQVSAATLFVVSVAFLSWDYGVYTQLTVSTSSNPATMHIPTAVNHAPVPMMANGIGGEGRMVDTAAEYASSVARDLTRNMDPALAQNVEEAARNAGIFVGAIADKLKADFPELFDPSFHAAVAADAGQLFGAAMNARPFAPN
jgi:hypothetical protein